MGDYISDPATLDWNPSKQGWLVSILELGAWLGCLYSGFLAEILSRKYAILVNVAIFILGVIIQATAIAGSNGASNILAGRFITGTLRLSEKEDEIDVLTVNRYGRWIAVYDRAYVQCRDCASGGERCPRGPPTTVHHAGHHDQFLDRLWNCKQLSINISPTPNRPTFQYIY
jgi:hypothetical protein